VKLNIQNCGNEIGRLISIPQDALPNLERNIFVCREISHLAPAYCPHRHKYTTAYVVKFQMLNIKYVFYPFKNYLLISILNK